MYLEEEYLQLSGIQHFVFCRRQWALIHIEGQWQENVRTVEGKLLHENAHDASFTEKRGDVILSRAMPVRSAELGISGVCDVVELRRDPEGVRLSGREGTYGVLPIEYKRGAPKENDADVLQLAAQAMCLEEMLCCEIPYGFLFYFETRRRQKITIDAPLRERVQSIITEMRNYFKRGYTPKVKRSKSCNACSLKHICLPQLEKKSNVKQYIDHFITEEE